MCTASSIPQPSYENLPCFVFLDAGSSGCYTVNESFESPRCSGDRRCKDEKNDLDRAHGGLPCAAACFAGRNKEPWAVCDRLVRQSGAGNGCAYRRGLVGAVISPFCAYALGIGPAFLLFVPCVALGNAVYAVLFALLVGRFLTAQHLTAWGCMALAAAAKGLALYLVLVKLVAPTVVPAAKLAAVTAAFTWPQLVTALIGGALACLLAPVVKKALEKRN